MMENLGHSPEHTQYQEDTHERWQMGQGFEHRYKAETTHTQPEDDVALGLGELGHIGLRQVLRLIELALQLILQDKGRYQHRDQRRNEDL